MRRYAIAYGMWLLGVLSFAALAWYYYRRVAAMGEAALDQELRVAHPRSSPPGGSRRVAPLEPDEDPTPELDIDDARPPSVEDVVRGRRR